MLKTFALRGRELPLTIYGPPGLKELFGALRRIFGQADLPAGAGGADAGRRARARRLQPRHLRRSRTRSRRSATRWSSIRGRAASTSRRPTRSASRRGRSAALLQRGESITLDGRPRRSRRTRCSGPRGRAARSCSAATPPRRRPCSRPRAGRTCWSTRRPSSTTSASARAGDRPLDRARGSRARPRRRGRAARADAPLEPLLRPRGQPARRGRSSPRPWCRRTST